MCFVQCLCTKCKARRHDAPFHTHQQHILQASIVQSMHICTCRRSLYFAACERSVQQASIVQFVMRWCLFSFSPSTVFFWQSVKQIGHRCAICFSVMSWSRRDRPVAPLYSSRTCRCPWHFFPAPVLWSRRVGRKCRLVPCAINI